MNCTLIFWVVLAMSALAQEGERGGRGGPGGGQGGRMMRMPPSMRILDVDGDGVISAAEIQQASSKFAAMDRNGDGHLTEDEMRPQGGGPPRGERPGGAADETVNTFMQFDKNKDGQLSKDEVPERMQGIFARNDTNKDGRLTRKELAQGAAKQSQNSEQGEGRGPRGAQGDNRGGMMRMDPIFAALDADQNGEISQAEWKQAATVLAKLDKNQDGQLTADEVRPNFPGRGFPGGERRGGDHE